jgi:hypothetical protein
MPVSRNPRLTALWDVDPEKAAGEARAAIERCRTMVEAAAMLHVSWRTLYRWIEIHPELADLRGKLPSPFEPNGARPAPGEKPPRYARCQSGRHTLVSLDGGESSEWIPTTAELRLVGWDLLPKADCEICE